MNRRDFSIYAMVAGAAGLLPHRLFAEERKPESDNCGMRHEHHAGGPIVHNWAFKAKHDKDKPGDVSLRIDDDGSWKFSGTFPVYRDHDVDIVLGLRGAQGVTVLFRYAGEIENGTRWDEQGRHETLKEKFRHFEDHDWYCEYRTTHRSDGIAKEFAERERKKREEAKEARQREEAKEREECERARREARRGGGGDRFWSVAGDVLNVLGDAASVASLGIDLAGIFA
jgi:hypothetical protein